MLVPLYFLLNLKLFSEEGNVDSRLKNKVMSNKRLKTRTEFRFFTLKLHLKAESFYKISAKLKLS